MSSARAFSGVVAWWLVALVATAASAQDAVIVGRDRIEVRQAIPFAAASAQVPPESLPLLKELSRALNENPQFTKVRIEGHTDSTGDPEANRLLSQQRATAVRDALVAFGVQAHRLTATGFGATDPLRSNATPEGRRINRRVVFEVLQIGDTAVERPPLAKVSTLRNRVTERAPLEEDWRQAAVGDGLRRSWRVRTDVDAGAGITFRDASRLEMREETLVIIFGATEASTRKEPLRAALQTGALSAWLTPPKASPEAKDAHLVVETTSGDAELEGGRATVRVASENGAPTASAFSNHNGKPARVFGKEPSGTRFGDATTVVAGYGSRVFAGKRPDPPKKLPPAPRIGLPSPVVLRAPGLAASLEGTWAVEGAASTIAAFTLELRPRDRPEEAPQRHTVPGHIARFRLENLPLGTYDVRGSVVDEIGLESDVSAETAVTVVAIGRTAGVDAEAPLFAGDRLTAPDGFRCAVDDRAFDDATALVVGPATTSIRCAPTSESTAPSTTAPLVVSPFSPMKGAVQTPMNAGADARVQLTSTTAFDASYTFAFEGAQLRSPPTKTSPTERVLALRVAPDTERVVVHIVRNGLSLQSLTFAVRADSAPPTLQQLEVTRPTDDAVLVRVDVVDDKSGVGPVNAEWLAGALGTALVATTPLLKQADGHYQALVGTDVIRGASAVRVVATDLAGNGPAMAQVPVPLQGDPSILWLVIPPALAAPLVLGGSALIVDGTFFDQTAGPLVGEPLGQALGLERQASADIERASGAALVVTGIAITAAGVVTYLVLQPSFASGANE